MEQGSRGNKKMRFKAQVEGLTLDKINDILTNRNGRSKEGDNCRWAHGWVQEVDWVNIVREQRHKKIIGKIMMDICILFCLKIIPIKCETISS